jgi:hypothetical protein
MLSNLPFCIFKNERKESGTMTSYKMLYSVVVVVFFFFFFFFFYFVKFSFYFISVNMRFFILSVIALAFVSQSVNAMPLSKSPLDILSKRNTIASTGAKISSLIPAVGPAGGLAHQAITGSTAFVDSTIHSV